MTESIAKLTLDESSIKHLSEEVEHERGVAIADLLGENTFAPVGMECGPYDVHLSIEEGRLVFDIHSPEEGKKSHVTLSVSPLRSIIRDYFLICESYYEALKNATPSKLEAVDMGRRGVHNEGSEKLREMLEGKISIDHQTSRRLFTLLCVLHIKQ
ncbi:MAG: UPF0262 family protein [Rickettsiales bacterium]